MYCGLGFGSVNMLYAMRPRAGDPGAMDQTERRIRDSSRRPPPTSIDHGGASPTRRAIRAMGGVLGPVIGITLVLMAVFSPPPFSAGSPASGYICGSVRPSPPSHATAVICTCPLTAVTSSPRSVPPYLRPSPPRQDPHPVPTRLGSMPSERCGHVLPSPLVRGVASLQT